MAIDIDMSPFKHVKENATQPSHLFLSKEDGANARKKLKLRKLDKKEGTVILRFPKDTWAITSSFFIAAFGDSVRKLGEEKFKAKYVFLGPETIFDDVKDGIIRSLKDHL